MKSFGFLFVTVLFLTGCSDNPTTIHEYWVCEEYCIEMQVTQSATPVFKGILTAKAEDNKSIVYNISGSNNLPYIEFSGHAKGYYPVYGSLKWINPNSLKGVITENSQDHYISFSLADKDRLPDRQIFPVSYVSGS